MTSLPEALFSTPEMSEIFSPESHIGAMLAFEEALARAEARARIIPQNAAVAIAAVCRRELFDPESVFKDAIAAATPVIPLVKALTGLVEGDAKRYVHWGATSQDVIDTALMLQARAGIELLLDGLLRLGEDCATQARKHKRTPMAGRTLLQQALPITFGLKAARWLALITRRIEALRSLHEHVLAVQLGGAAGTLAALGDKGAYVASLLAEELGLGSPDLPWHTERDRIAELASALGTVAGSMAKIAYDILLLSQTEIGEVSEGGGQGGSSAMPQKSNPVDSTLAAGAARLALGLVPVAFNAMVQEQERAAGAWQAEWGAIPDLFRYTAGAVEHVRRAIAGLKVNVGRMRVNLETGGGLIMAESLTTALARSMGRADAFALVEKLVRAPSGRSFANTVRTDESVTSILTPREIDAALDPANYLGSNDAFVERALAGFAALTSGR